MLATLATLKRKLNGIVDQFDRSQRCIYVDYPLHTNVGDLLINLGTEQLFREQQLNIWRRYNYYDFPRRVPDVSDKDVFLLHGGGNFGDLWFDFQGLRERIIAQYPRNRVIVLPQTVYYGSPEEERASLARMKQHQNLHVFARDFCSLERLQRGGLECVSAMPDTAHALLGTIDDASAVPGTGVLRILRQDREASSVPSALDGIHGDTRDWEAGVFSKPRVLAHLVVVNIMKGTGRYGPPIDCHQLWYGHRDRLIQDAIRLFSQYETIMTNRLHAMLLGLFLGKRVIVFDNNYGKLSSYYQSWLSDVPDVEVHFVEPARVRVA